MRHLINETKTAIKSRFIRVILPRPSDIFKLNTGNRIVIVGMFGTLNGIGQSALYLYRHMKELGFNVEAIDSSSILNQFERVPDIDISGSVPHGSCTVLLVANPPETERILHHLGCRRWKRTKIIGYWAWELSRIPSSWVRTADYFNAIWTPSQYVSDAVRSKIRKPVYTIPIPVSGRRGPDNTVAGDGHGVLKFLIMADGKSSFDRKNVAAGIDLFLRAFRSRTDVTLTVKIKNESVGRDYFRKISDRLMATSNVQLFTTQLSDDEKWAFLNDHDVILSTHRAEGFGLHLAEAMSLGKVAIATNWSGNLEFMTELNSVLLPHTLIPVNDSSDIYSDAELELWAEVDIDASVPLLQKVVADRTFREKVGQRARADMSANLGNSAIKQLIARNSV